MKITGKFSDDVYALKKALRSDDVKFKEIKVGRKKGCIIFAADLADKTAIGELVLRPLEKLRGKITEKTLLKTLFSPETETAGRYTDKIIAKSRIIRAAVALYDEL